MVDTNTLNQLFGSLEDAGAKLLDTEKSAIETAANAASDAAANKIIGAVANQVKTNGIAGVVLAPVKAAVIAAEPELDSMINAEENALIEKIEAALKADAARREAPAV